MIQVVCHDSSHVMSGTITRASDMGCVIQSSKAIQGKETSPQFSKDGTVLLNLLDEQTGESINVKAKLRGVLRQKDQWSYHFEWSGLPPLLKKAI